VTFTSGAPSSPWGAPSLLSALLRSPVLAVAGTAVGVLLLVRTVDLPRAGSGLRQADADLVALGVGLTGVGILLTVLAWGVLLRGIGHAISWRLLTSWYLQALFVGHVAPSGAAGDAVRVVRVGKVAGHGRALASLATTRMASALGTALFGLAGAVLLHSAFGVPVLVGAAGYVVSMIVACVLAFQAHAVTRFLQNRGSPLCRRAARWCAPATEAFEALRRNPSVLAQCLAIHIAGWAVNLIALQLFASAVGINAGWSVFAVAVPFSLLAASIPVAVRGIGIREGVLVGMLAHLGIDPGHGVALAVLLDLQLVPFALLGGALVWTRR
jgi:uncharacterized protein (TIRG00374 family)